MHNVFINNTLFISSINTYKECFVISMELLQRIKLTNSKMNQFDISTVKQKFKRDKQLLRNRHLIL